MQSAHQTNQLQHLGSFIFLKSRNTSGVIRVATLNGRFDNSNL